MRERRQGLSLLIFSIPRVIAADKQSSDPGKDGNKFPLLTCGRTTKLTTVLEGTPLRRDNFDNIRRSSASQD